MTKDKKSIKEQHQSVKEALEIRVKDLEELVRQLLQKVKVLEDTIDKKEIKIDAVKTSDKIDDNISFKKIIRHNPNETHSRRFECENCDEIFTSRWKLEHHLEDHKKKKEFKCNQCGKEFFLEWRLNQHLRGHSKIDQKCCHYYNNDKTCPYEIIGCKFKHESSAICLLGQNCQNRTCQFRHEIAKENKPNESLKSTDKSMTEDNVAIVSDQTFATNKQLGEALEKMKALEKINTDMETKLKVYGMTIRKLRKERENN
jgi:DNA-binding PadR family transcriptional regulator